MVAEPCAGPGWMASVLEADSRITSVITNDIDAQHDLDYHDDAADQRPSSGKGRSIGSSPTRHLTQPTGFSWSPSPWPGWAWRFCCA